WRCRPEATACVARAGHCRSSQGGSWCRASARATSPSPAPHPEAYPRLRLLCAGIVPCGSLRVATATMAALDSRVPTTRPVTASRPRVEMHALARRETLPARIRKAAVWTSLPPRHGAGWRRWESWAIASVPREEPACSVPGRERRARAMAAGMASTAASPPPGQHGPAFRPDLPMARPRRAPARPDDRGRHAAVHLPGLDIDGYSLSVPDPHVSFP